MYIVYIYYVTTSMLLLYYGRYFTQAWIDLVKYYQLTNRIHLSFNATFNFSNNSGNEPIGLMTGR